MAVKNNNPCTPTEEFIPLIYEKPEIWDQFCPDYANKALKAQSWSEISNTLGVPEKRAKLRWTNLRDFFRREMKKVMKKAGETGDPEAYVPKWKNFQSMLFLKDNVMRTMNSNLQDSYSVYPHHEMGDGEMSEEEEDFFEEFSDGSLANVEPDFEVVLPTETEARTTKRAPEMNGFGPRKKKRENNDLSAADSNNSRPHSHNGESVEIRSNPVSSIAADNMDGDYHFLMSMLPSFRRIREDRKTHFKMKVLQLILEEERRAGD